VIENQLDTSMKSVMLGFSKKYSLYNSGCLVHCISRLLNKPRLEVHEKLKQFKCFFADGTGDVCLLDLTKVPLAYPQLKYIGKQVFNQDIALQAIKQASGLIVEVDGNSIMEGTQQHFVFFTGNGELEDPLGGIIRKTTYYKKIISIRIFEVVGIEDMTDEQKRILEFLNGKTEGDVRQAFGALADSPSKDKQIQTLQAKVLDLEKSLNDLADRLTALESNIQADLKLITSQQDEVLAANKSLENANKTNIELTKEKNQYKNWYENKLDEIKKLDKMTAWQHIKYGISLIVKKSK
jgi:hypothetical protein